MHVMPDPSVTLRPLTADDSPQVLAWNAADVEYLSPLTPATLLRLEAEATAVEIIEHNGSPAGFVVTVAPGSSYRSPNYRWFAEHYGDSFLYLDRIVIDPPSRRLGLASRVYDLIEDRAQPRGRLVVEVNVEPPNVASLRFHAHRGFVEVGRHEAYGHVVALLSRSLA